ncbi:hypothetical protein EVAR_67252_1 [Eumeta japonica]|uniref:Uncharacterized protein n=1 Tax=Eumeta variegata TaxID=151549 RepID=A0A4C1YQS4_EUMVA|nr:hypothetical protein EVAR_67252_1 [Eumeta japonica]
MHPKGSVTCLIHDRITINAPNEQDRSERMKGDQKAKVKAQKCKGKSSPLVTTHPIEVSGPNEGARGGGRARRGGGRRGARAVAYRRTHSAGRCLSTARPLASVSNIRFARPRPPPVPTRSREGAGGATPRSARASAGKHRSQTFRTAGRATLCVQGARVDTVSSRADTRAIGGRRRGRVGGPRPGAEGPEGTRREGRRPNNATD